MIDTIVRKLRKKFYTPKRNYAYKLVTELINNPTESFSLPAFADLITRFAADITDSELSMWFSRIEQHGTVSKQSLLYSIVVCKSISLLHSRISGCPLPRARYTYKICLEFSHKLPGKGI